MNSDSLLKLLLTKHSQQLCVPECKTGSAYLDKNHRQMDLWVMNRSWTQGWTICYEIKVSRQDFLRDEKWPHYLPFCNYFYFVSPLNVIKPEETPEQAGLLVGSKNLKKLYTKKKAPCRDVEIPESLWRYILMWRTTVTNDQYHISDKQFWTNWLKEKDENKRFGHIVGRRLNEIIKKQIDEVQAENQRLKAKIKNFEELSVWLKEQGINIRDSWQMKRDITKLLTEISTGLPMYVMDYLEAILNNLTQLKRTLNERIDAEARQRKLF